MRIYAFSLILLALSACTHALLVFWALRVFPRLEKHARAVWTLCAGLVLWAPLARLLQANRGPLTQTLYGVSMIEMSLVVLSMLPLLLVRAAVHWGFRAIEPPPPADEKEDAPVAEDETALTRRQVVEGAAGALVLASTGAALGWGMVRGRHAFVIEEVPVRIAGLPRALDGYTIAQISDIHVGPFVGERELREGFDRVLQARPDLIVATGDLVDHDESFIPEMARALGSLQRNARDGVMAILGNHDYYTGAQEVLAGLRSVGVRALVNEGVLLHGRDGGGFALLGVADMVAAGAHEEPPSLPRAMAMVPPDRPRILLAHQPDYFGRVGCGKVALQLSGHTHGGQINPGFRPGSLVMRYLAGRYEEEGSTLWVNRGFGVAGPPSRIGAPPEVTKIVLVSA